ncbi:hypothetical protein NQ318_015701 [Aromia moschata]|uniref:Uncharacterized protein n=1 Tax=Aromia moschata TaxID=1265417 RepID=A0AAV8YHJ3_9CUCU|nr:hypothetical protein NQ318_015701 [Aromia moschata]
MEIVGSRERNIGNIIVCCIYALGQAILGLTAWLSPSWRVMLRILYIPGIVSLIFFWTVPESVRWLLSVNKREEARNIIIKIGKTNGKQIPRDTLNKLMLMEDVDEHEADVIKTDSFLELIKCRVLLLRTLHCSFTWICSAFVYYGLTIHSVSISDNIYLSFIFAVVIEIPGYLIYYLANERIGRRIMLFLSLISSGIFCVAVGFIPTGRWLGCPKMLPLLMFGVIACAAGSLSLFFPETLNVALPDTVEEAVNIGKSSKRYKYEENSEPLKT